MGLFVGSFQKSQETIVKQSNLIEGLQRTVRKQSESLNEQNQVELIEGLRGTVKRQSNLIDDLQRTGKKQSEAIEGFRGTGKKQSMVIESLQGTVKKQSKVIEDLQGTVKKQNQVISSLLKRVTSLEEKEEKIQSLSPSLASNKKPGSLVLAKNTVPKASNAQFTFDIISYLKSNGLVISEGGTRVKAVTEKGWAHTVMSKTGFSKGLHIYKVKNNDCCCSYGIGILTSTSLGDNGTIYYEDCLGYSYYDKTVGRSNGGWQETFNEGLPKWKKGSTVTVALDCDNWKWWLWLDNSHLITIDIEKNRKYYPAISCCDHSPLKSDFKLIVS